MVKIIPLKFYLGDCRKVLLKLFCVHTWSKRALSLFLFKLYSHTVFSIIYFFFLQKDHKSCPLDANIYATRKTVAQGMMDIALLTANASQLKHVLATAETHDYYLINLVLIGSSMILQVSGFLNVCAGIQNLHFYLVWLCKCRGNWVQATVPLRGI